MEFERERERERGREREREKEKQDIQKEEFDVKKGRHYNVSILMNQDQDWERRISGMLNHIVDLTSLDISLS